MIESATLRDRKQITHHVGNYTLNRIHCRDLGDIIAWDVREGSSWLGVIIQRKNNYTQFRTIRRIEVRARFWIFYPSSPEKPYLFAHSRAEIMKKIGETYDSPNIRT